MKKRNQKQIHRNQNKTYFQYHRMFSTIKHFFVAVARQQHVHSQTTYTRTHHMRHRRTT